LETIIMKKYLIPTITILLVLAVTWAAFGQADERARRREEMRQRFQNMSEEERAKFLAERRQRGGFGRGGFMNPEAQEQAIKTIEEQVAKLKAAKITMPEGGFQNLSEEERTKFRENMRNRQQALQTIVAQVAMLQGRGQRPATEGGQFILINTSDLKPIQEAAKKEKAEETTQLLQRLIARGSGRGFGGREQDSGQRPQGGQGQRGARGQRPQGGQRGGRQRNR
jgi:hypothetical protein